MPTRPPRNCKRPGCYGLAHTGDYCEEHRRQPSGGNRNRAKPDYGRAWPRLRKMQLARFPLCHDCQEAGRTTPAKDVHHVIDIKHGGTNAFDNLMSLCRSCHSRRTMQSINAERFGDNDNS